MATTVKISFQEFKQNLEITNRQSEKVSNCRENLVKTFVDSHISLHNQKSKVIGSYDRSTIIRPLSDGDVDIMLILHYGDNKEYDNSDGTTKILDKVKYVLDKKYPDTKKRRDRNCITMKLSEFNIDVVPAFYHENDYYHIPDSIEKKWLNTNPIKFSDKITLVNKNMGSSFVPLIKMVKAWNRANSNLLNGYHIECIMYHNYKTYQQGYTYNSMLKIFFEKLPNYIRETCIDPVTNERVDLYLGSTFDEKRKSAIKRAEDAEYYSALAFQDSENGNIRSAIDFWKHLLGYYFPEYG